MKKSVGEKGGETSWREACSTLLSDPTSRERVRVVERGKGESEEWVRGGPAYSRRVDSRCMTKGREERASAVSLGWPH